MVARAFKRDGAKTSYLQLSDTNGQRWLRLALFGMVVLALLARLLTLVAA